MSISVRERRKTKLVQTTFYHFRNRGAVIKLPIVHGGVPFFLYRELSGRKNLGGGLLKSEAADIKQMPLYFPIADKETILSIAGEIGKPVNLSERLETSVQKKIDELVFSYFEIVPKFQSKILNELLRVFRLRLTKAKS